MARYEALKIVPRTPNAPKMDAANVLAFIALTIMCDVMNTADEARMSEAKLASKCVMRYEAPKALPRTPSAPKMNATELLDFIAFTIMCDVKSIADEARRSEVKLV